VRCMDEQTGTGVVELTLTREELELVKTALHMLEDTYGREEADELSTVQALLERMGS
jgi:hypothetical protein